MPWKQGPHQRNENSKLGFIKSVDDQYRSGQHRPRRLTPAKAELYFQITKNELNGPIGS